MVSSRTTALVAQGEQTREALLDIAVDLFGRYGYKGCSLAQIAKEGGVVQSALLYHFESKEKLLMTALLEHYPLTTERQDIASIAEGRSTFGEELERATAQSVQNPSLVRFFSVMAGESLTETHPAHKYFISRYDTLRVAFATAIRSGHSLDPTAQLSVEGLVTMAFASLDGLQAQWLRNPMIDLLSGVREIAGVFEQGVEALSNRR
ncbi:TetR/AcrR family transcriptional regulator [Microbacterium saperdae]